MSGRYKIEGQYASAPGQKRTKFVAEGFLLGDIRCAQ